MKYQLGDIIKTKNGDVAYIQYKSKKSASFGVTFSEKDLPWNLIGNIGPHCLGDGFINLENISEKIDKRNYIEKFGLSLFHDKRSKKSILKEFLKSRQN